MENKVLPSQYRIYLNRLFDVLGSNVAEEEESIIGLINLTKELKWMEKEDKVYIVKKLRKIGKVNLRHGKVWYWYNVYARATKYTFDEDCEVN